MPSKGWLLSLLIHSLSGFTEPVFVAEPLTTAGGTAGQGALRLGVQHSTPRSFLPWESRDSQPLAQPQGASPRDPGELRGPRAGSAQGWGSPGGGSSSLGSPAHLQHPAFHTDCSSLSAMHGTDQSLHPGSAGERPAWPKPAQPQGPRRGLRQLRIWPSEQGRLPSSKI